MFQIYRVVRPFHTSRMWMSDTKPLLSALRKKTGYPLTNCRKALEACNNDLCKAEAWLKEQALALGWAKAFKLSGRSALQGLIAVTGDAKSASMVEVNCETDFVAKNDVFQNLAFNAANTCYSWVKGQNQMENSIFKVDLDAAQLRNMPGPDGRKLDDEVALVVSQVGENIQLRRAICVKVGDELSVAFSTHPTLSERGSIVMGKYGSILAYKASKVDESTTNITKQLCQHIIGMNPTKIGNMDEDEPKENKDNELCLIHQEFIMDQEITVSEILKENDISVVEFKRFECGEDLEEKILANIHLQESVESVV